MKTWPLRWQITLWAALVTGLALAVFGLVVAFTLYSQQVEAIDAQLAAEADLVLASQTEGADLVMTELDRLTGLPRHEFSLYGYAIGKIGATRVIQARPETLASLMPSQLPAKKFLSHKLDKKRLRIGIFTRNGTTLLLATSLHRAEDSVGDLLGAYLLASPLVLLLAAGGSWWIARRALRPITDITRAAASITADRLAERLPMPDATDEIGQHIQVLNGMFDRLQRSFEQANRFTADAAHELRTPLTIMRGQIEDALRSGRFGAEQEHLLLDLLEETTGLQKISDNLLLLARFDIGKNTLQLAPLDFSALVGEAGEDAELLAAPKQIHVCAEIAPAIRINGDRIMLRRVVLNLLDNAVKFNRERGELTLLLHATDQEAILTVGNTGPGIPAEQQGALFERFFRIGSDRNLETGGSGLGLSLCREIVSAHSGRIDLSRSGEDWTEFSVYLPRPSIQ